jgi:putrescine transport system substrate-binding protein
MWFDMMAMPKDAANPEAAHKFINYLLEPKVIAKATNYVGYPNANAASKPYVEPALLNDPNVYPSADVMNKLYLVTPYDQKVQRVVTRIWQSVKSGS